HRRCLRRIMPKFEQHIFVCTNQRPLENPRGCCDQQGLGSLQLVFKQELSARGLKASVRANRAGCMNQCEHGPTVVVYPEAVWYGGVTAEDVPEIIESHIVNRVPVARLMLADECINTPDCAHKSAPKP
ncbi:MAG: (2Fe-2S) ferredoxin domain-containing protein, partial [Blastocatellia bacterium]